MATIVSITVGAIFALVLQYLVIIDVWGNRVESTFCGEFIRLLEPGKQICIERDAFTKEGTCIRDIKMKYREDWEHWMRKDAFNTGRHYNALLAQRMLNYSGGTFMNIQKDIFEKEGIKIADEEPIDWNQEYLKAVREGDKIKLSQMEVDATRYMGNAKKYLKKNDRQLELQYIEAPRHFYKKLLFMHFVESMAKNNFTIEHKCNPPFTLPESAQGMLISWLYNTTVDPNDVQMRGNSWNCPIKDTDLQNFQCDANIPCSLEQWQSWCDDGMQMSKYVKPEMIEFWFIAQIIIGLMITMDMYNHALLLRHVDPLHKVLLLLQIQIAAYVCRLNAEVTARSDSIIDVLMNAAGLYILNEFDNIVLMLFLPCRKQENDDEAIEALESNITSTDRLFGSIICYGHVVAMIAYWVSYCQNTFSFGFDSKIESFLDFGPYGIASPVWMILFYMIFYGCVIGWSILKVDMTAVDGQKRKSTYMTKSDAYKQAEESEDELEGDASSQLKEHSNRIDILERKVQKMLKSTKTSSYSTSINN